MQPGRIQEIMFVPVSLKLRLEGKDMAGAFLKLMALWPWLVLVGVAGPGANTNND